tara:strand:- start:67 stop:342 length:276 start_codon:yes stop_codon:yes gene_type:complete
VSFFLEIKETNIAKITNITDALPVEKKLPDVLSGKNSIKKIKIKGKAFRFKELRLNSNGAVFFIKSPYNIASIKIKIITKPTKPRSDNISK